MVVPIMTISSSEHHKIIELLSDISDVDTTQIWPDYRIYSKLGYTVGIARASIEDVLSNKMGVHSHIVFELSRFDDDLKIFLLEGFVGMDSNGKIVLNGGRKSQYNYLHVMNNILSACLSQKALYFPSPHVVGTAAILRNWNCSYFQKDQHLSLQVRPEKNNNIKVPETGTEEKPSIFDIDLNDNNDKVWWLADLPGINMGEKRARSALKRMGSITNLIISTRQELAKIDGWGKIIADKFRSFSDKELNIK